VKLRDYLDTYMQLPWSPEQIVRRLAHEAGLQSVSSPTIYTHIRSVYGRQLEYELQRAKQKRTRKSQRTLIALEDRILIDKRLEVANMRMQYGHWEGDFMVSGMQYPKTSLFVLYERVSQYTCVRKVTARTTEQVEDTLAASIHRLGPFKSLTLDNDIAFARHAILSELLSCPIYFCRPYHSWEKGGVENANHLIRRFIPKGCNIANYTNKDIARIEQWMNTVPRKILGYRTATAVMEESQRKASHL
jgi:IS30 family transposase